MSACDSSSFVLLRAGPKVAFMNAPILYRADSADLFPCLFGFVYFSQNQHVVLI